MARGVWTLETSLSDNQGVLGDWLDPTVTPHAGIQVWSPDNDHRALGYLDDYTITQNSRGLTLRAGGFDWLGLLDDRLIYPSATMDIADFWDYQGYTNTGTAPAIARDWIGRVIFASFYQASLLPRELPWSAVFGAGATTGASVTAVSEALPTLQRVRELLTGTQYTARMVPDVFNTAGRVESEFIVGERPKASRPLSVDEGTLGEVSRTIRSAKATKVIGVGAEIGGGPQREVAEATNLAPADWQRRYIERFINEPDKSGAELLEACQQELAAAAPSQSVVAANPRAGIWGTDLDVGWLVDVAVRDHRGDSELVELPVIASTLTADARGHRRTIEFGSAERRNLAGVLATIGGLRDEVERLKRRV